MLLVRAGPPNVFVLTRMNLSSESPSQAPKYAIVDKCPEHYNMAELP